MTQTARSLTKDIYIPVSSAELLELLRELYPPKCIRQGEDLIAAHRYAAIVELLEGLTCAFDRTQGNIRDANTDSSVFKQRWPEASVVVLSGDGNS